MRKKNKYKTSWPKRIFNFITTQPLDRYFLEYFYCLFIYKGDRIERVIDLRIKELTHERVTSELKRGMAKWVIMEA